ncbi:MAG: HD domain-containing protein [Spirochaetaceae bacterium]|nr:HD domain-containing protein [Spirochaetaceae bacterium]
MNDFNLDLKDYADTDREKIITVMQSIKDLSVHTVGIASILVSLRMDLECVISALLLDVFTADTDKKQFREIYGKTIAGITENAIKALSISAKGKTIADAEKIRKMLFAMVKDIRVIFICLADKMQTLRTLQELPFEARKPAAQECLDVYAPLANRLGLSGLKDEMEDLCLKNLNREAFNHIRSIVALKHTERQDFLNYIEQHIIEEAKKNNIKIQVQSRAKHFYSIFQKMRKRNKEAGELYDLFGLRLLCESTENCYTLLGIVHRLWKPVDKRFKDYIAMPKSNGYQSLHTTVLAFDADSDSSNTGNMLEIQIRTFEMHETAEYGYASHWLYKKGKSSELIQENDLPVVNTLMRIIRGSSETALDEIKKEILKDSIFIWTPQGKVIELPQGATPIDFAYSIHSAIGDHCSLAKADGIIIPLNAELKNTQIVEIVTSQTAHPNSNWLQIVKTAKARSKIRTYLAQQYENMPEKISSTKKKTDSKTTEKYPATHNTEEKPVKTLMRSNINPLLVRVQDEKNMLIRFAKCCNPVLGDLIVGYVSRGRGIIIHRQNCHSLAHIHDFPERCIESEWEHSDAPVARIKVEAKHSCDLFSEIDAAVKKCSGNLIEGHLDQNAHDCLLGFFTLQLSCKDDLKKLLKSIRLIPHVINIRLVDF